MFRNLKAEMARNDHNNDDLARAVSVDIKTVGNKMNGKTEWTRKEMFLIKKKLYPTCTVDYLFATE